MKKILAILLLACLMVLGCSSDTQSKIENSPANIPSIPSPPSNEEEIVSQSDPVGDETESTDSLLTEEPIAQAASDSRVKEFEMISRNFEFVPSTISVNEGDTVLLHIVSTDIAHGIGIPAFGVSEFLPAGKTVDVEFIADTKGEFPFICNVPCGSGHRNMKGLVVVQ